MEINVDHERKMVTVWLPRIEAQDTSVKERLKPLYGFYKGKKYMVAVFESGEQDLAEATSALLCKNRKQLV